MNTTDLSRLSAKQKRLHDWRNFVESGGVQVLELRARTLAALNKYSGALEHCWEAKNISDDDWKTIEDLERQLEELNEEARLRVVGKL